MISFGSFGSSVSFFLKIVVLLPTCHVLLNITFISEKDDIFHHQTHGPWVLHEDLQRTKAANRQRQRQRHHGGVWVLSVERDTLSETNIAPENRPGPNRKVVFQPSIFRGELLVSRRDTDNDGE